MIKAHLILSQTRLIFSRLTDFSSVLTEFNSIWSDLWSKPDPNPTSSTTRVYKKLNPNFSLSSQNRPRHWSLLSLWRFPASSDEASPAVFLHRDTEASSRSGDATRPVFLRLDASSSGCNRCCSDLTRLSISIFLPCNRCCSEI